MVNAEDIKELENLTKQLESSEVWKIEMGWRNLGISYYIFMTNYNQLKTSLELFDRKEASSELWAIKNRNKMNQFHTEVIRLFHNYLASVKSLVEHTRIMVKEVHGNKEFLRNYELKKQEIFVNSPLSRFVQELRNYILHKGIPNIMVRKTFDESNEEVNSFMMDLTSLRSWGGWKAKSKEYLDNAKDNINLYEIIIAYGSFVTDFYNWFLMRQEELYKEEFRQSDSIKKEYNQLVLKVFPYLRE